MQIRKTIKLIAVSICLLVSYSIHALPLSLAIPYYVDPSSPTWVHVEKVKQALPSYEISVESYPLARVAKLVEMKQPDIAFLETQNGDGYYVSNYSYSLNAAAVLLRDNAKYKDIKTSADLNCCSVVAFQNASNVLGDDFKNMATQNKNYKEVAEQDNQVKMLFTKRADLIVLADVIFDFYLAKLGDASFLKMPVEKIYFLGKQENNIKVVFKDKAIMELFNNNL